MIEDCPLPALLNVAVSVLVVPEVAPGTVPPIQFPVDCHAPEVAVELHVLLAASAGEVAIAKANARADEELIKRGTIRR
jgi:hypothetical protein